MSASSRKNLLINLKNSKNAIALMCKDERGRIEKGFNEEESFSICAQWTVKAIVQMEDGEWMVSLILAAAIRKIVQLEDEIAALKKVGGFSE